MGYKLFITQKAHDDLAEIIEYITTELKNPDAATRLFNEVSKVYDKMVETPLIYAACRQPILKVYGYRKAVIMNYVLIYKVDTQTNTVYIERFFSNLENYEHKL